MIIERKNDEIIFRLKGNIDVEDLQDLTCLLEFKEIGAKSKATQGQVDDLVNKIKKGRWDKTKGKIGL